MKWIVTLGLLAALCACGVDGEPIQPTARVNIGIGANGISPNVSVGANRGPVAVRIGL